MVSRDSKYSYVNYIVHIVFESFATYYSTQQNGSKNGKGEYGGGGRQEKKVSFEEKRLN